MQTESIHRILYNALMQIKREYGVVIHEVDAEWIDATHLDGTFDAALVRIDLKDSTVIELE